MGQSTGAVWSSNNTNSVDSTTYHGYGSNNQSTDTTAISMPANNMQSMGRGLHATYPSWMAAANDMISESQPRISDEPQATAANQSYQREQPILPHFPHNDPEVAATSHWTVASALEDNIPPPPFRVPPPPPKYKKHDKQTKNEVSLEMWQELTRAGTRKKRQMVVRKWIATGRVPGNFKLPSDWKKPPDELTYSSAADSSNENEQITMESGALESLSSEGVALIKSLPTELGSLVKGLANDASVKSSLYLLSALPDGKVADPAARIQSINDHLEGILCNHSVHSARKNPTKLLIDICTHLLNKCQVPKLNSHDAIELARRRILLKWSSRIRNPNVNDDDDIRQQYQAEFRDKRSYLQGIREEARGMIVTKKSRLRAHKMRTQLAGLAPRLGPFSKDPLYVQQYLALPCYSNMKVFQRRIENNPSLFEGDSASISSLAEKLIDFVTKLKPEAAMATHLKEEIFSFLASENSVETSVATGKGDEDCSPNDADDDSDVVIVDKSSKVAPTIPRDKLSAEVEAPAKPQMFSHETMAQGDFEKAKEASAASLKAKLKDALKAKKIALMKKLELSRKAATPPPPITGLRQLETSFLRISNISDTGPSHLLRFVDRDFEESGQPYKAEGEVCMNENAQASAMEDADPATKVEVRKQHEPTVSNGDSDKLLKKRKLQLQAKLAQARLKRARLAHAEKTKEQSGADAGKGNEPETIEIQSDVPPSKPDSSLAKLSREQLLQRRKMAEYRSNVRNMKHIVFKQEMLLRSQEAELVLSERAIEASQKELESVTKQLDETNRNIVTLEAKERGLKTIVGEQSRILESKKRELRNLKEGSAS